MNVMEVRKTPTKARSKTKAVEAIDFVGEVKDEIKRIHWTDKEELKVYTKIVVYATFLCGMGIYLIDIGIQASLFLLEGGVRLLFG